LRAGAFDLALMRRFLAKSHGVFAFLWYASKTCAPQSPDHAHAGASKYS
jgi:hypothetical protein